METRSKTKATISKTLKFMEMKTSPKIRQLTKTIAFKIIMKMMKMVLSSHATTVLS